MLKNCQNYTCIGFWVFFFGPPLETMRKKLSKRAEIFWNPKFSICWKFQQSISKTVGCPHFCEVNISNWGSPFTSLDCPECISNIVAQTRVFYIYTIWNGKCKVFQFNQSLSVGPKVYLSFDIDKTDDYFVMITSSNEYVFALHQQWLESPPMTAEVKSNMFIEFRR